MKYDAKKILDLVDNDFVIQLMIENGSPLFDMTQDTRSGQTCLWFQTICHGGDSHKLCYFSESKDFYCYTNCGRMTFFNFIKRIMGYDKYEEKVAFVKSLEYIANKLGISDQNGYYLEEEKRKSEAVIIAEENSKVEALSNKKNKIEIQKITKFYNKKVLNDFDSSGFYQGWIKEGISIDTLKKFNIMFSWDDNHIIIPHYDIHNNLVGIRRRTLNPEEEYTGKYMPAYIHGEFYEHALGLNLYGININKKNIRNAESALLVEGEKSVLLANTYDPKSIAVATCGFSVSNAQIKILENLGVTDVYLGFDRDFDMSKYNEYVDENNNSIRSDYKEEFLRYCNKIMMTCKKLQETFKKVYIVVDVRPIHYSYEDPIIPKPVKYKNKYDIVEEFIKLKCSPLDGGIDNYRYLMKHAILYNPSLDLQTMISNAQNILRKEERLKIKEDARLLEIERKERENIISIKENNKDKTTGEYNE